MRDAKLHTPFIYIYIFISVAANIEKVQISYTTVNTTMNDIDIWWNFPHIRQSIVTSSVESYRASNTHQRGKMVFYFHCVVWKIR